MKNGSSRRSPDLQTPPDQPLDRERELLFRRIKVLEQRLLMLEGDDRCSVHPKIPRDQIIQHPESFEVRSDEGAIVRQFAFDDDARRRAISGRMSRKRAFQAAKAFASKNYTVETEK